jgi:hypothetical protein
MLSQKFRLHAFQTFTIASDNNYVIAVRGKEAGQLETDPTAGASNQSRPIP